MNISSSTEENPKIPSSSSQASVEVTDCMVVALNSSSNTKPIDNDTKKIDDRSSAMNMEKTIDKDLSEKPNETHPPSKNDFKTSATAAPSVELDVNVENKKESFGSPISDAELIVKEDIVNETAKKLGTSTDTTISSGSSPGDIDTDSVAIDSAEPNPNTDVKNDSNNNGALESKEKAAAEEAPKKRTRKKWKKPPGKPNRPLSAYNLYFRKERGIMLGDAAEKTDQEQGKKRVHRKTHGKIGFADMAKIIGAKWKTLPEEEREEFVKVAVVLKERYAKDLTTWREEQKQKAIINSMGPGRKSKVAKGSGFERGSDDEDDLVQSIAEDREKLLRQHQAFRMQMMQEMQVGHLGRLPGEGHGRQMPTIEYLRNMQDDRTGQFFGRNRNGAPSSLFSHYPSAAEGSGRDLFQQMAAMTSDPDGQGREPDQFRQLKMTQMGGTMGTMGGAMGGSMGNSMSNPMRNSMSAPMGNPMGNSGMSNPMGRNGMGNTMGMIPINNGASQMSNSAPHSQYELERFQHMHYQNQMHGMNNNNGHRGQSEMRSHEGSCNNNNMEAAAMMRFQQQNRYN